MDVVKDKYFYIEYVPNILCAILFSMIISILFGYKYILIMCVFLLGLILFFFRGKSFSLKKYNLNENYLTSPAEGKILKIYEHNNLVGISIFLNLHNIHIQYYPCDAIIISQIYSPGTFCPAYIFEKSKYNERLTTSMYSKFGNIYVIQYAGQVAKKIVSFHNPNDHVRYKQGDPLGLIKFGSRVDLLVPKNIVKKILVAKNENVWIQQPLIEIKI